VNETHTDSDPRHLDTTSDLRQVIALLRERYGRGADEADLGLNASSPTL